MYSVHTYGVCMCILHTTYVHACWPEAIYYSSSSHVTLPPCAALKFSVGPHPVSSLREGLRLSWIGKDQRSAREAQRNSAKLPSNQRRAWDMRAHLAHSTGGGPGVRMWKQGCSWR